MTEREEDVNLVLRPLRTFAFILELPSRLFPGEVPVDFDTLLVRPTSPGGSFAPESCEIGKPSFPKALPPVETDLDFCLVQPTAVRGGIVSRIPFPDLAAYALPVEIGQ